MPHREGGFVAADGTSLFYRAWEVPEPIARLLLIHGFTEHSGRYERTGSDLAAGGISTYAFDLRGHGRSDGQRGDAPDMQTLLGDVTRFRAVIDAPGDPDRPLFLLGHSLGGLIALRLLVAPGGGYAGSIIVAPWLGLASAPRWKIALGRAVAPILPRLPVSAGIEPEHLSRDGAVVQSYRNDPLVHGRITPRLFRAVDEAISQVFANAGRIPPPMLMILAGADRIVDTERTLALAERLPDGDFQVVVEPDAYHEVLNDTGRDRSIDRILEWIRTRASSNPSPPESGPGPGA